MTRRIKTPGKPHAGKAQQLKAKELKRIADLVRKHDRTKAAVGILHGVEGHLQSVNGQSLRDNRYVGFWAQIIDRDNSTPRKYSFLEMQQNTEGVFITHTFGKIASAASTSYPAYEVADANVPIGAVVWMQRGFGDDYYIFSYAESPVPAKITGTTSAPASTLNGALAAGATSLTITSAADFPGRNGFYVKIEDEYIKVTAGAGTTSWAIERGKSNSDDVAHADTTAVTLAGAYSWEEQKPDDNGGWQAETGNQRTGTAIKEPAYERNHACDVASGSFVLLWRRTEKLAGASTLSAGIDNSTTTIPITARDSFPQTGDFYIMLTGGDGTEIMLVTAGNGAGAGNFTATRGQFGTTAEAWASGADIAEVLVEWVFDYPTGAPGQNRTNLTVQTGAVTYANPTTTPINNVNKIEFDNAFFALRKPSAKLAEVDWLGFKLRKNSTGSVGQRRRLNVIEGNAVTITYADDSGNDEHDVTIAVTDGTFGDADHGAKAVDADAQTVTAGNSAALTFNDTDEYDNTGYHDTGSNTSRMTFAFGANGRYIVCYSTSADVTFAGTDVTPETISTYAQLNGAGEVTGSRDCGTIWRVSVTAGTGSTSFENDHLCLGRTFMVNITDFTTQYLEIIADASGCSLDVAFDDRSFSVHLLNRAGAV